MYVPGLLLFAVVASPVFAHVWLLVCTSIVGFCVVAGIALALLTAVCGTISALIDARKSHYYYGSIEQDRETPPD